MAVSLYVYKEEDSDKIVIMTIKIRNSNFELLRLVSMFFIVMYHFLCYIYLTESKETEILYRAMWLPLHIGVICFVLISGYFHINPTCKGAAKLLLPVIFYYTVPCIIANVCGISGGGGIINAVMIFSKSPYWFVRVYFYLFLMAPLLNKWLDETSFSKKKYILCVLGFIGVFMAIMGDRTVYEGKNVVLFMFLYVIGDIIRDKQDNIKKINNGVLFTIWLIFNIGIVVLWILLGDSTAGKILWHLSFMYSHPILIANGVLLFVVFGKMKLNSKVINYGAASTFSIYILTECSLIKVNLIHPVLSCIYSSCQKSSIIVLLVTVLFTMAVMALCIIIDKLFTPLFNCLQRKVVGVIEDKL